ncbi:MAG: Rne/Rng family ribonuclease [Rickettsiaceae bacterium]|nr:Rne/Rng family ribonuclease [Rickettsiaceae bacterium]
MKKKKIIIDGTFPRETRVIMLDKNNQIEDFDYQPINRKQLKGNIYLAKVTRVEPSLQAAFVDYGDEKSGFLPFNEIHTDYYNIPTKDKKPELQEITPPEITSDDLKNENASSDNNFEYLADNNDIDPDAITKMVDEKMTSDFNIEANDFEVDNFDNTKIEKEPKQYKIQEVIKKGQILLVQVIKEERGNKGVSLTTFISLAGKYCVLMPNNPYHNGISRKISNSDERKRLKDIISNLTTNREKEASSVIARTAGAGHTTLEIKRDYNYLARLWNKIREATLKSKAPCFIHQEDGILLKTIRDMFDRNVKEVLVHGNDTYNECLKYMNDILPNQVKSVKEYKGAAPIFTKFNIEDQLIKLYQPNVKLPSGGYIVINPTEALISIDVNSGKATGERNVEEMALKTNLEATRELSRQIKLRNLSGLLVIDFIDMSEVRNRKIIERLLKELLSRDKARIQINNISNFGLLEMSRQRLVPSFLEINSEMCGYCSGKGIIRGDEANAMLILRTIENEIYNSSNIDIINIYGAAPSVIYLLNNKREEIIFIENKYSIQLKFFIDKEWAADSFSIEKVKLSNKNKTGSVENIPALQSTSEIYNQVTSNNKTKRKITKTKKEVNPQDTANNNSDDQLDQDSKKPPTSSNNTAKEETTVKKEARARRKITKKKTSNKKKTDNSNVSGDTNKKDKKQEIAGE